MVSEWVEGLLVTGDDDDDDDDEDDNNNDDDGDYDRDFGDNDGDTPPQCAVVTVVETTSRSPHHVGCDGVCAQVMVSVCTRTRTCTTAPGSTIFAAAWEF
jgi:hypothetical protein